MAKNSEDGSGSGRPWLNGPSGGTIDAQVSSYEDAGYGGASGIGGSGGVAGNTGGDGSGEPGDASAAGPDVGAIDGPARPHRLLIFNSRFGLYHDELKMQWSGTTDGQNWERSLADQSLPLRPVLAPLAAWRDQMLVVEGLALHVVLANQLAPFTYDSVINAAALTGDVLGPNDLARGPSLDFLVAEANTPPGGVSFIVGGDIEVKHQRFQNGPAITFDRDGAKWNGVAARDAYSALFPAKGCLPQAKPPVGHPGTIPKFIDQMIPIVAEAFRCDRTRVVTLNLPQPSTIETDGFFLARDCLAVDTEPTKPATSSLPLLSLRELLPLWPRFLMGPAVFSTTHL